MRGQSAINFLSKLANKKQISSRLLSTTPSIYLDQKWRIERGLPMNPNACGKLTDGPDFTYLKGRATPYGSGQLRRMVNQKEIAQEIIKLTGEVDFAVERHKQLQLAGNKRRKDIIDSKLKPKGELLLGK